jgi:anti-sigma factor RsiW
LEEWLRPKLGGWVALPDLSVAGFTLTGGRLIPGPHGPAAFVVYQNMAGARVGVVIESGEGAAGSAIHVSGALHAAGLAAPSLEQGVVVAANAEDIERTARLARFAPP